MKEFLSQSGAGFIERDIVDDESAIRELEALGIMTTPVVVAGDQVIVGFDLPKLEKLVAQ